MIQLLTGYITGLLHRQRADVQLSIDMHPASVSLLMLIIANVGPVTAFDVELNISPEALKSRGSLTPRKAHFHFASLLPGARHSVYVNSASMLEGQKITATALYRDKLGTRQIEFKQSLEKILGFIQVGDNPAYEVQKSLKSVAGSLELLTSGRRTSVDSYTQNDRDAERQS